jgi:SnoaL-like domain
MPHFYPMRSVIIGPGALDGKALFADRDFELGEVVVSCQLQELTLGDFRALSEGEQLLFVHSYSARRFLYPVPVRYTNHSDHPSVHEDFQQCRLIARRDISEGEPITIDAMRETDHELASFMEAFSQACQSGDRDELSQLVDDTAVMWLPGGSTRGKARVVEELQHVHAPDGAISFGELDWIVGRHRWEARVRAREPCRSIEVVTMTRLPRTITRTGCPPTR